jgi:hypothetical protein
MSFQATVKSVDVQNVVKGKARYSVATVTYDYQGETRTQKVMSFTNPGVFETVQTLKDGDRIEITSTKNAAGYNEWAKVEAATAEAKAASPGVGRVTGSNYETPQERADNRVRIVRQSSISNAIATLATRETPVHAEEVLDLAQRYFDWVYASESDESQ